MADIGSSTATGAGLGSVVPGIGTAIGAGLGAVGGLLGNLFSSGPSSQAQQAILQNAANLQAIGVPSAQAQQIALQQYSSVGNLTSQLQKEQSQQMGPSAMNNVAVDPRLVQAQATQLQSLQQQGKTGLTPTQQAQLSALNAQTEAAAQSRMQGILANQAARGQTSSGQSIAAQMLASQQATQAESQAASTQAGQAYQNALQAVAQAGGLANQMNNQQFAQGSAKAQAADAINQFNAIARQNTGNYNTQTYNQAAAQQLANQQAIANQNVGLSNQQQIYNQQLIQQQYQNQLQKAKISTDAANATAGVYQGQANSTAQMGAGLGQAAGTAVAGLYNGGVFNGSQPAAQSGAQTGQTLGNYNVPEAPGGTPLQGTAPAPAQNNGFYTPTLPS